MKLAPEMVIASIILSLVVPGGNAEARQNQITVQLFQQPCWLKGPLDKKQLQQIHSITPGNIFPLESADKVLSSLKIVRSASKLPKPLESYRIQLQKHLEALEAFFKYSRMASVEKNPKIFNEGVKDYIRRNSKTIHQRSVLFKNNMRRKRRKQFLAELLEIYQESITPNPESDFHRGLSQLKVRYNCEFDRNHDAGHQEADEDEGSES